MHPPAVHRPVHEDVLVFCHVPKTAGTVVKHVLGRLYRDDEIVDLGTNVQATLDALGEWSPEDLARLRVLHGHAPYGAHSILDRPARYVTLLRDPVERVLSFYYYIARRPDHYHFEFVHDVATSPGAFVARAESTAVDNFAVRLISGVWHDVPFGQLERAHLELAQQNIAEHFAVAGTQEQFDLTLCWIAREFDWRDIWYAPLNLTADRPTTADLSDAERSTIERHNTLDAELHAWVTERMIEQTAGLGPRFAARVRVFSLTNPLVARTLRRAEDAEARGLGPSTPDFDAAPRGRRLRRRIVAWARRAARAVARTRGGARLFGLLSREALRATAPPRDRSGPSDRDARRIAAAVTESLPGHRALVIGVRWAVGARPLLETGWSIEVVERALALVASPDDPRVHHVADLTALAFDDRRFDVVVAPDVATSTPSDQLAALITELSRVCRGWLVLGAPQEPLAPSRPDLEAAVRAAGNERVADVETRLSRRAERPLIAAHAPGAIVPPGPLRTPDEIDELMAHVPH